MAGVRGSASFASERSTIQPPCPPDVHIFTRSKLPWVGLPSAVPSFEVYYDTEKLWPKASLDRRRAIL
jgi:hypothetical protein